MHDLYARGREGVFLRRHALAAGYDDSALYGALRAGDIARVRHGAYVDALAWQAADEAVRHRLRAHAVALVHGGPFVLSHTSAASLHGMRLWGVDLDRVHVTRPRDTAGRRHAGVTYHRGSAESAAFVHGTPVVAAAEAAFGAASVLSVEAGVVILDSAYDLRLCSREELHDLHEMRHGWPGTARLRIVLNLAQPGSQSVGESRMRFLFWRHHIPKPDLQYVVRDGSTIVGITDFAWPEHRVFGEFDGRMKYDALLRPGESAADAVLREKAREDRIRELTGWRFIRFGWSDLADPMRTAERVRRALNWTRGRSTPN